MDERNEAMEKADEVMLPGFRFHPTDEELVGFYLKRKVQQKPLSIELIRQLDIYKYDPWDLPKVATSSVGEKEWYFYCPRDRKYRNSARPNRVTGAGFWKATGTDRPIYSSEGTKSCIGLKKSLVFYKGRAAKGVKTDWMMHEFRLPSLTSDSSPPKRHIDHKSCIPANDSWAICRIFKKANSMARRALSHSWVSPSVPGSLQYCSGRQFSSEIGPAIQLLCESTVLQQQYQPHGRRLIPCVLDQYLASEKPMTDLSNGTDPKYSSINVVVPLLPSSSADHEISSAGSVFMTPADLMTTLQAPPPKCRPLDHAASLLLNIPSVVFGNNGASAACMEQQTLASAGGPPYLEVNGHLGRNGEAAAEMNYFRESTSSSTSQANSSHWGTTFPFGLPPSNLDQLVTWESYSTTCSGDQMPFPCPGY